MAVSVNHTIEDIPAPRAQENRIDLLGMSVPASTIVDSISFETIRHVTQNTGWTERVATVTLRVRVAD